MAIQAHMKWMAAAGFAAAIFLSACAVTPKSSGQELRQRIEQGIAFCEDPKQIASLRSLSLDRVIGPPVCVEQTAEFSRKRVRTPKDRQVFFSVTDNGQCQFTLRNVDEEGIRGTVAKLAIESGWLGVPIIEVTSCRSMTCNGRRVCAGLADGKSRFFDPLQHQLISFRWKLQNDEPGILAVSVHDVESDFCERRTGVDVCYVPELP